MNDVKVRLLQYVDYKDISNRDFAKEIGASPNVLSTKSAIGSNMLVQINIKYPELNIDWVVAGRGDMFYKEPSKIDEPPINLLADDGEPYTKTTAIKTLPLFSSDEATTLYIAAGNDAVVNQRLLASNHVFLKTLLAGQAEADAQQLGITLGQAQNRIAERAKQAAEIPLPGQNIKTGSK
jgi:hypothetical protein